MNTPVHEEEKNLPDTNNTPTHSPKEKWYHRFRTLPKGIIITIVIALLIIVSIITYYEHKLEGKDRHTYGYDYPRIYAYHMDPWDDLGWFDDRWRDPWRDFDRRMEMMERRQRAMMESLDRATVTPLEGKYSGTRISGGDTLTYTLDIASGSLSGTYSGTASGALESLGSSLRGLGYSVEKKDSGYTFSGKAENLEKVMELFR